MYVLDVYISACISALSACMYMLDVYISTNVKVLELLGHAWS